MNEVLRQRLLRKIESLPEEKIYQVLDYIEFLESKYARDAAAEASGLQKFAENLQDRMRKKAMNPETIREAFQLIAAADRVLSGVSSAGKQILDELAAPVEPGGGARPDPGPGSSSRSSTPSGSAGAPSARRSYERSTGPVTRGPNEPPPAGKVEPSPVPPRPETGEVAEEDASG